MIEIGCLYGISVGTGDPELITLKGLRLLQSVSVVAFPAGVGDRLGIAQRIILPWLKEEQEQLALQFPYVQDELLLQQAWQEAATKVWSYLQKGQNVAFACEGDVSFYSTFTYLAQTLQELYPQARVESVPGVCAPMAAVAVLGIPLTVRRERLAVLPALYRVEELETALQWAEVVVLMKVSSVYSQVWEILRRHDLLQHSAVVERATLPEQVIYRDLRDRPDLQLTYFSVLIVQHQPTSPKNINKV